jgi:hypothetical protein
MAPGAATVVASCGSQGRGSPHPHNNTSSKSNGGKKRIVPNLTAINFLDSVIAYLDAPEANSTF